MLTRFCPKCYAQNRAEDRICAACGAGLDEECGDYVDKLINFSLRHPVPSIPPMAAEILGKIGDKRAVEPLIEVIRLSEDPGLLEAAVEALGKLNDKRAVPALGAVLKDGALTVRLKAVGALGTIGNDEAVALLQKAAAGDPSSSVREEARIILKRSNHSNQSGDEQTPKKSPAKASDSHRRGINITLTILDEALCGVEQWAKGRELHSVLYNEHNTLSSCQRQDILSEIDKMREVLRKLQQTLQLEPTVQDARSAIRGQCAGLWEHIVELKPKHLRRYGDVPPALAEHMDHEVDALIEGLLRILDILKRAPAGGDAAESAPQ